MKQIITLALVLTGAYHATAQPCLTAVKAYIETMASIEEPNEGQVYYMHFSVESLPTPGSSAPASAVDSKIYRGQNKVIMETKDIAIYQDSEEAFMVIRPLKKIIRESDKNKLRHSNTNTAQMAQQQKLVIDNSETVYCKTIVRGGKEIQQLKLKPGEEVKKLHISDILIDFDPAENRLLKVQTIFMPGQPLARQITTYKTIDFDRKGIKLPTAHAKIFDKKGRLLPAFTGYTVTEN